MSITLDLAAVQRRVAEIAGSPQDDGGPVSRGGARFGALVGGAMERLVDDAARAAGVDSALARAVARTESGFDPHATSRTGAAGVMQLMPDTARRLGVTDRYDPVQNVRGGVTYLHDVLARFGGDLRSAVAAYNAGPAAVLRYGGVPPFAETQAYVARVLAAYRERERP